MDIQLLRHRLLDDREELPELDGPVARVAFSDDFAGGDVEGGEERGGAVALVVVGLAGGRPGRSGSIGWVRSSAWICDFSSTQSTTARSGGTM